MIDKKIINLKLSDIDASDDSYLYTYQNSSENLKKSIEANGILNPIIVQKKQENLYRIVAGFKRFEIAKEFNFDVLSAYFVQNSSLDIELMIFSLNENASFRSFNEIEKSIVISKALNDFKIDDKILLKICKILKISFSEYNIQKYIKISKLLDELKFEILSGNLHSESAVILFDLGEKYVDIILRVLRILRININVAREIIENLRDIVKLGNLDFERLNFIVSEVIADDLKDSEKVLKLRNILMKLRFPNLTQAEFNFNKSLSRMKLDSSIEILNFPFFERDEYKLIVKFKDIENFEDLKEKLRNFLICL